MKGGSGGEQSASGQLSWWTRHDIKWDKQRHLFKRDDGKQMIYCLPTKLREWLVASATPDEYTSRDGKPRLRRKDNGRFEVALSDGTWPEPVAAPDDDDEDTAPRTSSKKKPAQLDVKPVRNAVEEAFRISEQRAQTANAEKERGSKVADKMGKSGEQAPENVVNMSDYRKSSDDQAAANDDASTKGGEQ